MYMGYMYMYMYMTENPSHTSALVRVGLEPRSTRVKGEGKKHCMPNLLDPTKTYVHVRIHVRTCTCMYPFGCTCMLYSTCTLYMFLSSEPALKSNHPTSIKILAPRSTFFSTVGNWYFHLFKLGKITTISAEYERSTKMHGAFWRKGHISKSALMDCGGFRKVPGQNT